MILRPIGTDDLEMVAGWMERQQNYRWLDFGAGHQAVGELSLRVMLQRDLHELRIYTADDDETPVGIVGLSDVDRSFRTATAWVVLGRKEFARSGLSARAVSEMLRVGFEELELEAINAWTLDSNKGGQGIIERVGFRYAGRQRRCHYLDGEPHDRLWFDILAEEFTPLEGAGEPGTRKAVGHG